MDGGERYEAPDVEEFGKFEEITRHHGKIARPEDSPSGSREHTGGGGSDALI